MRDEAGREAGARLGRILQVLLSGLYLEGLGAFRTLKQGEDVIRFVHRKVTVVGEWGAGSQAVVGVLRGQMSWTKAVALGREVLVPWRDKERQEEPRTAPRSPALDPGLWMEAGNLWA